MKKKRSDLDRLLHVLDATGIEYAKAQIEVTEKATGVVRHMTVIQNGFTFDRMTGKYLFTHFGALLKPIPPGAVLTEETLQAFKQPE